MYIKHFVTMLLALVLMAVIGLGFLVLVNQHYHRDLLAGITSSVSAGTSVSTNITK